jgi:proline iminopeptidase
MLSRRTNMSKLYPDIEPFDSFFLKVSSLHTLYVELVGNPQGIPIVFLHGGPGSGLEPNHRRFFDPSKFYVILFDQRGCGKSTPYAELEGNTTDDLVSDIEKIRNHLGINKWHVFGGSWGSFLALKYAIDHKRSVRSLILRGMFLGTKEEISFFYQKGASYFYPEKFEEFISILNDEEKNDIVTSFYQRLHATDAEIRKIAALKWTLWEASCLKLKNTVSSAKDFAKDFRIESLATIETHYFINGCFVEKNPLLTQVSHLTDIPITCVHGRYDLICPFENAYKLKKTLPHTQLYIAESSGHSGFEEEILEFLLKTLSEIS